MGNQENSGKQPVQNESDNLLAFREKLFLSSPLLEDSVAVATGPCVHPLSNCWDDKEAGQAKRRSFTLSLLSDSQ